MLQTLKHTFTIKTKFNMCYTLNNRKNEFSLINAPFNSNNYNNYQ